MDSLVHSRTRQGAKALQSAPGNLASAKAPSIKRAAKKTSQSAAKKAARTNDPARTMADILAVATHEFAEKGLAGARIDHIAQAMRTSKRMIYYYFNSKEGLYVAVLEDAYRHIREAEAALQLDDLRPEDALRKLVGFTVDYQLAHPEFTRLVMTENIHRGEFLAGSRVIQQLNLPAIGAVDRIYERGRKTGVFRAGLDAVDLHMSISALAVFNVANKHTFALIFKRELDTTAAIVARRDSVIEMILRFVCKA